MSTQDVIFEKIGCCGVISLNRPKALNAVTLDMVHAMSAALKAYAADPAITYVTIRSTSARAFCSGGDIKTLYELGRAGRHAEQMEFFRAEYNLCRQISRFPKPYVALIDAITMGGGVGASIYGSHRVAGEALQFAMPEVGIGFFPDIGGTWFLPRLKGKFGTYLALTGSPVGTGDAVALGIATAHVPAARFDNLLERLSEGTHVDEAIAAEAVAMPDAPLLRQRHFIEECFAPADVAAILEGVDAAASAGSAFAVKTGETLRSRSPTSLAIALRQMQLGPTLDLESALRLEFRLGQHVVRGQDYYEGVRTALIDKHDKPKWKPADIGQVSGAEIADYFTPLTEGDLIFSAPAGAA